MVVKIFSAARHVYHCDGKVQKFGHEVDLCIPSGCELNVLTGLLVIK